MGIVQVPYNPLLVRAVIAGVPVFDPADDDNALMAEYEEDRVTVQKGMYGDAAFEINVATNGEYTIVLKAKSPTNAQLSILMNSKLQFRVKLVNKNTLIESCYSPACMVKTPPPVGGGTSAQDRTWVISATTMAMQHDGHRPAVVL